MDRKTYYKTLNWSKSPFIKSTSLDTPIIRKEAEYQKIEECIGGWDRIMVFTAPIGYGKTTFMNLLVKNKPEGIDYTVCFDAYEPVDAILRKVKNSLPVWKRFFAKNVDRTEFGTFLQDKLGSKKMLFLFDEAQDYDDELFKWLRIVNDRANNVFMVFFGLPKLDGRITSETSFRDRKTKSIQLNPFTLEELKGIIIERIRWVGGEDIKPFTEGGLRRLCESANSIPRRLLDNGQKVIEEAAIRENYSVNETFVESVIGYFEEYVNVPKVTEHDSQEVVKEVRGQGFIDDLSPMQKQIVDHLMTQEDLSISELSEMLGSDIRSVGSLIRKLRGLDRSEVLRKPGVPYPIIVRKGKDRRNGRFQYVYTLSDNARRLMAEK